MFKTFAIYKKKHIFAAHKVSQTNQTNRQKADKMKRIINTLLICAFAMGSSFASSLVDSIAQPSHITLTRHDASGNMLSSSYADFGYYGDGKLKTFNYAYGDPDKTYSYDGDFLTKIRIKNGTGPVYFETFRYYYENNKVSNIYHDGDEYGITHSYRIGFTYDAYGRLEKKELFDYYNYYFNETDSLWSYWTYEYFDNRKTRKETMYEHPYSKEYEVISIETYRYNDDYRLISIQKDSETSPLTLTTYTYTDNGELESETKQNWEDGRWVNASKFVNVFDFEGRIEEHRMGEWSGNEWNLNKKALYVYDANGLCKNISIFRETEETMLAWDYEDDTLFYDYQPFKNSISIFNNPLLSMQEKDLHECCGSYNEMEIEYVYTEIPTYNSVEEKDNEACKVYPNPGNGSVTITAPFERSVIRFYDLQGRLAQAQLFDFQTNISTADWKSGLYLWEIWQDTQKIASGKWVKQ